MDRSDRGLALATLPLVGSLPGGDGMAVVGAFALGVILTAVVVALGRRRGWWTYG